MTCFFKRHTHDQSGYFERRCTALFALQINFLYQEKNDADLLSLLPFPPYTPLETIKTYFQKWEPHQLVDMVTLRDYSSRPPKSTLGNWIPAPAASSPVNLFRLPVCLKVDWSSASATFFAQSHSTHQTWIFESKYY